MQEDTFSWVTEDKLTIYGKEWKAEQPRAVVCLEHGLGEHINRYGHLARYFTSKGFTVIGHDRRGHGKSGGKRGHAPNMGLLLDEAAQLLIEAEVRYPRLPTFLYGHSMGGHLVLAYTLKRHPSLQGVIASAPWIRLAFEPSPIMIALGKAMQLFYPGFQQASGLKTEHLCKVPEVVRDYEQDPLVHGQISAAMGMDMLRQSRWLDNYEGTFPVPLLLMHGDEDHIVSPEGSRALAQRLEGDVTYREWKGLYHEIHNEEIQEEVFDYTLQWIGKHMHKRKMAKNV